MPNWYSSAPFGSPPRVWGRPTAPALPTPLDRFTPTRVGTTTKPEFATFRMRGSPPRVWGRLGCGVRQVVPPRFTPTRVGTTLKARKKPRRRPVHPHACGDDHSPVSYSLWAAGSPPRVWGRPWRHWPLAMQRRFTPTRVGTTAPSRFAARTAPVHPHACGDDTEIVIAPFSTSHELTLQFGRRTNNSPS